MLMQEKKYHEELKLELQGAQLPSLQSGVEVEDAEEDALPDLQQRAKDADSMSEVSMSRKKRKLLEAMKVKERFHFSCGVLVVLLYGSSLLMCFCVFQIGKKRKEDGVNLLKERKRRIDQAKKSSS